MLFACPQGAAQKEKIATKWKGFVMPKSSIHIKVGNVNFVIHSTRNNFSYSVVFTDEKNEHLRTAKEALKIYREELAKRALAYTKNTGQKLQKNTATILSAVVNLEQHHTLQDLQPILQKLEQDLDTKIISASIHRDEGTLVHKNSGKSYYSGVDFALNRQDNKLYWIDPNTKEFLEPIEMEQYEVKKNYHCHIEMMGIDSQGKAIKRNRLNRHYLSNLQTFVANTLGMERGKKLSRNKHKDPNEFKKEGVIKREAQAEKEKETLAKVKDLKEENKRLREELKQAHAKREHYAELEQFVKDLKEQVKAKELTIEQLKEQMQAKEKELLKKIQEKSEEILSVEKKQELLEQIKEKEEEIEHKNKTIEKLNNDVEELKQQVKAKEQEILSDINYKNGTPAPWSAVAKHYRKLYEELKPKYSYLKKQKEEERKRREKAEEEAEELKKQVYSDFVYRDTQEPISWQDLAKIYKKEAEEERKKKEEYKRQLEETQRELTRKTIFDCINGGNKHLEEEEIELYKSVAENLKQKNEELETENRRLKEENKTLKGYIIKIAQALQVNIEQTIEKVVESAISKAKGLFSKIAELTNRNTQLEQEIEEIKEQDDWNYGGGWKM